MTILIKNRNFSKEALFSASKSSGPGGQSVNKVNSKVELRFSISDSLLLSDEEKELIFEKLKNKINKKAELIVVSQSARTQIENKEIASNRLNEIISKALKKTKQRIATRIPRSVILKRLKSKKRISTNKNLRKPPEID